MRALWRLMDWLWFLYDHRSPRRMTAASIAQLYLTILQPWPLLAQNQVRSGRVGPWKCYLALPSCSDLYTQSSAFPSRLLTPRSRAGVSPACLIRLSYDLTFTTHLSSSQSEHLIPSACGGLDLSDTRAIRGRALVHPCLCGQANLDGGAWWPKGVPDLSDIITRWLHEGLRIRLAGCLSCASRNPAHTPDTLTTAQSHPPLSNDITRHPTFKLELGTWMSSTRNSRICVGEWTHDWCFSSHVRVTDLLVLDL